MRWQLSRLNRCNLSIIFTTGTRLTCIHNNRVNKIRRCWRSKYQGRYHLIQYSTRREMLTIPFHREWIPSTSSGVHSSLLRTLVQPYKTSYQWSNLLRIINSRPMRRTRPSLWRSKQTEYILQVSTGSKVQEARSRLEVTSRNTTYGSRISPTAINSLSRKWS